MIRFTGAKTRLFLILYCLPLGGCLSSRSEPVLPVVETIVPAAPAGQPPSPYVDRAADGISFTPEKLPTLPVPAEIGIISRKDASAAPDGGVYLSGLFRAAYREALMREMPLLGALGMDEAHLWPEKSRLTWVQNWRSASRFLNDPWGIAGLTLAVLNTAGDKVFTVSGDILNMYGNSSGLGGENGVTGYGPPLTDVFFIKFTDMTLPVYAQRFYNGLIYVDGMGKSVFIAGEAPSNLIKSDETVGFYPPDDAELRKKLKFTFEKAYRGIIDRYERPVKAGGPVEYLDFGGAAWLIETEEGAVSIAGLYVQQYDGGEFAVVLPVLAGGEDVAEDSVFCFLEDAHTIAPPFSAIINGSVRLPGALGITPHPLAGHGKTLEFLKSLALYGIPLTDSFVNIETMVFSQRFSNGVFRGSIF